jgi:hypothetical protein
MTIVINSTFQNPVSCFAAEYDELSEKVCTGRNPQVLKLLLAPFPRDSPLFFHDERSHPVAHDGLNAWWPHVEEDLPLRIAFSRVARQTFLLRSDFCFPLAYIPSVSGFTASLTANPRRAAFVMRNISGVFRNVGQENSIVIRAPITHFEESSSLTKSCVTRNLLIGRNSSKAPLERPP